MKMHPHHYEELKFLRYFYEQARYSMGPADSEIYDMIKDSFEKEFGELPEGYTRSYE